MANLQQRFQFMESQAAHIEPEARMIQHGSIQYPELVSISREASPHADVITYYTYDGTGDMVDIANRGNDIPLVQVSEEQHNVDIHWKAIGYDWSDREIGRAMYTQMPLSDRKVNMAFRIAEEVKERVFLFGDSTRGWDGFMNHPNIPTASIGGTRLAELDDDSVFDFVNTLIGGAWAGTNAVRICDTLLFAMEDLVTLGRPMGNDANQSVFKYIQENNIYTRRTGRQLMIRELRQLANASTGSNTNRCIAYPRDRMVLRYHIPQELQFTEPQREGLGWTYYGSLVLAGVEIMEPNAMRYGEGL